MPEDSDATLLLVATDEGDFYTDMGWDLRRYAPGPLAPHAWSPSTTEPAST
ncbi:hypothetical protein [Georgenia sp. SUBG003]|uniref:hypothetical protein n=1 Tax=Georgenia sp. SUBG003 TaxID=1497974 RepID=UPI003AB2EBDC